jgi:hypothetical protein
MGPPDDGLRSPAGGPSADYLPGMKIVAPDKNPVADKAFAGFAGGPKPPAARRVEQHPRTDAASAWEPPT